MLGGGLFIVLLFGRGEGPGMVPVAGRLCCSLMASSASLCRSSGLDCTSLRGLVGLDYASLCHLPLLDPELPLDHGRDGLP